MASGTILTNLYFGQFLIRLVVCFGDNELIFLLLFETMISQACKKVLIPPFFQCLRFRLFSCKSAAVFSCLFVFLVRSDLHYYSLPFARKQLLVLNSSSVAREYETCLFGFINK